MKHLCFILLFSLGFAVQVNGQRTQTHEVSFANIDGFSGYVTFTSSREGFATQLHAKDAVLVLTDYECTDNEKAALQKAGIDFWAYPYYYRPTTFQVVVEGRAYVREVYFYAKSLDSKKLSLNNGLGNFNTFEFDEDVRARAKKYHQKWNESYWEAVGGYEPESVTALYLSDLKTEIRRILYEAEKEKENFEKFLAQGTQAANEYNFAEAESSLASAVSLVGGNSDMESKAEELENLIAEKKSEKEKANEELNDVLSDARSALWKGDLETAKTLLEKAYKMDPKNETMIALSQEYAKMKEEKDEKEFDEKMEKAKAEQESEEKEEAAEVYYPKTNRQLYDELKAMTDRNPGMLNNPNVRSQLRSYKAYADRDDQNKAYYDAAFSGGYDHSAATYNAYANAMATNQKVANTEIAVGAVVDGLTSMVNSIIAENERKRQQEIAEEKQREANFKAKWKALYRYDRKMAKEREEYVEEVRKNLMEIYDKEYSDWQEKYVLKNSETLNNGGILYETEVPDNGWDGFEKKQIILGDYPHNVEYGAGSYDDDDWLGNEQSSYIYIVSKDGKYGIINDSGNPIYAPQFDKVIDFSSGSYYLRFLVKINDKWGEVFRDGSILNDIKYDGIWYMPGEKKLLRLGNRWFEQPLESDQGQDITEITPGELVPVFSFGFYNSFPNLLSTKEGSLQNKKIEKSFVISNENYYREILFKLNGQWYKQAYENKTQTSSLVKMPDAFVQIIKDDGEYNENKRKTFYKYGIINQDGRMVIPMENEYIEPYKNIGYKTDKGYYDNNGTYFSDEGELLKNSANNGNIEAQIHLGDLAYDNENFNEAAEWFQKAVAQGSKEAVEKLGDSYYGIGYVAYEKEDYTEALVWFKKAAEQNLELAYDTLSKFYLYGLGVEINMREAYKWLEKSVANGNHIDNYPRLASISNIGTFYGIERKHVVPELIDKRKSLEWRLKLIEAIDWDNNTLEEILESDEGSLAVVYLDSMGDEFYTGKHIAQSYDNAYKWNKTYFNIYKKAGKIDINFYAKTYCMATNNSGNRISYEESFQHWQELANQGNVEAQTKLGLMYAIGEDKWIFGYDGKEDEYIKGLKGIARDQEKAIYWLTLAAKEKFAEAQFCLGLVYMKMDEYNQEKLEYKKEASKWLKKAARREHALAKIALAELSEE